MTDSLDLKRTDTAASAVAPAPSDDLAAVPVVALDAVAVPAGFALTSARQVPVGADTAWLLRLEREDGRNGGLGGEHVSWLVDGNGGLRGLTRMIAQPDPDALPSGGEAREVATSFLQRHAPDLARALELRWVDRHDETVRADGADRRVSGMKVKCRNRDDGRYFWVIVGPGGDVVTFERDIVWNTLARKRVTEKWLHDAWLMGE